MQNIKNYGRDGLKVFQWLIFLLANGVAIPIVVGKIFHLPMNDITSLMQRTFFVVGISTFLQGYFGHRMPIIDGPAGTWLGVFVIMADMAVQKGLRLDDTLMVLEGGMFVAGLLLIVLGIAGVIKHILSFFTPLVTGCFLLLLSLQLSGVFIKGMMNVSGVSSRPDQSSFFISFIVFLLIIGLSIWGRGWMRNYALLIGITIGWIVFYLAGKGIMPTLPHALISIPHVFAWGTPYFDAGMAISSILLAFMMVSNLVANISAMAHATSNQEFGQNAFSRGGIIGGVSQIVCSLFSIVGIVPLNSSVGFVRMTGESKMRPLLIASLLLAVISLIPALIDFLSLLPSAVANAAMLATFVQSVGVAFQSIAKETLDERRLTILGITLLFGVGAMFLPASIFQGMPSVVQYVFGNGLLVGTIIVILLEKVWRKKDRKIAETIERNTFHVR